MSWQTYVDTNMIGTGQITDAVIMGLDGSVWATSPKFAVTPDEFKNIVAAFDDCSKIQANGLFINKTKYISVGRPTDRTIYGKLGNKGCICAKSKSAVLIALYGEKSTPGRVNTIVEGLADYLVSVNY